MNYSDLTVWKQAIVLVKQVYCVTQGFPSHEKFGLTSQMRRAAVSVPSNIAEGAGRLTLKAYINHLSIARGSLFELETQVYLAVELKYLELANSQKLMQLTTSVAQLINGVIRKLKQDLKLE